MISAEPATRTPQDATKEAADRAGRNRLRQALGPITLSVLGVAIMVLASGYQLHQATQILAFSIAILSLNFLSGYSGQISLGHGAFLAIGGYATAILMVRFGVPFWLAVPAGGCAGMTVGFLLGFPALRLELTYLAMATFSLAIVVPQFAKNKLVDGWTGGVQGLQLPTPSPWSLIGLNLDQTFYAYALICTLLTFVVVSRLVKGRVGRALEAIREQPTAADTMGIHARAYKTSAFAVSAFFASVAGGIGAVATQYVAPDSFSFFLSITLLLGAVIGGFHSIYGALFGGVFVVLMPNYAERISQGAPSVVYGLTTICFMFLMPEGIAGLLRTLSRAMLWARHFKVSSKRIEGDSQ